jgi:hypothetical protein
MNRTTERGGFALPMAVLLLLVTTSAIMMSLNQGSTERRVIDSELAGTEAFLLAETALERFATDGRTWSWEGTADPLPFVDSGRVELSALGTELGIEGEAEVIIQRLWLSAPNPDSALYLVRSTGVRTGGAWQDAPAATRVVTRIAKWKTATIDIPAAWTSLGGLNKNGAAGDLDGNDACATQPAMAGVAVPTNPGYTGPMAPLAGDPPLKHIGDSPQEAADSVDIDWQGILNGGITPDYTIPPADWNSIDFTDWPVVLVTDPGFSLPGPGRGVLIASGDLTISGSNLWQGVVMVGGKLTSNGNNTVSGLTISGLNTKLGVSVPPSDVGNGTKVFEYNSCNVFDAMRNFGGTLRTLENTWLDNWALY